MTPLTLSRFVVAAMVAGAVIFAPHISWASKYEVLYSFQKKNNTNITDPAGLMMDQSGNLYGVTEFGPHHGLGTVYELSPGRKYSFRLLHGFCHDCDEGAYPNSPLIMDVQGNLYGTTSTGFTENGGTAFRVSPDGTFTVLYPFCSLDQCKDGTGPTSGLTYAGASTGALYDGVSPLYGVAEGGGTGHVRGGPGGGVLYQLSPGDGGWTESVLYNFCSQGGPKCTDGAYPSQDLLLDSSGAFFGVTEDGGNHPDGRYASGAGVAYELVPSGGAWSEKVLHSFCAQPKCSDGDYPSSSLLQDAQGNLYGTTGTGGRKCSNAALSQFRCGILYELSPSGSDWQQTVLYDFCRKADCKDGAGPLGPLVMNSSGTLFGTTYEGGGNDAEQGGMGGGVVYQFSNGSEKVLYAFCADGGSACTDGYSPQSGLTMNSAGFLYGTTDAGAGTGVFRLKP